MVITPVVEKALKTIQIAISVQTAFTTGTGPRVGRAGESVYWGWYSAIRNIKSQQQKCQLHDNKK